MGTESWLAWCASLLSDTPAFATGEANPPEDLSRITIHQHPDRDTP